MKKDMVIPGHKNREMNARTFKLRRMVINLIHDAKKLVDLPRIDVRITDTDNRNCLGSAWVNGCAIWIPANTLELHHGRVKEIVFHEILHAAFGVRHDESCPLMGSILPSKKVPDSEVNQLFIKHAKAA